MILIRYYTTFSDHMWRFYIRNPDIDISTLSDADRANWTACDNALRKIMPPQLRGIISTYYRYYRVFSDRSVALNDYCYAHHIPVTRIAPTIRAAQLIAAQERGIVDKATSLPSEHNTR